jgi:hypothetical protein
MRNIFTLEFFVKDNKKIVGAVLFTFNNCSYCTILRFSIFQQQHCISMICSSFEFSYTTSKERILLMFTVEKRKRKRQLMAESRKLGQNTKDSEHITVQVLGKKVTHLVFF